MIGSVLEALGVWGVRLIRPLILAVAVLGVVTPGAEATTTWTVTNTGDGASTCPSSSGCTLRGAVGSAGNGDTVSVPGGTYTVSSSNPIVVAANIVITGAGASSTIVDGAGATRIFEVGPPLTTPTVTISGLKLQHGNGAGGDSAGSGGAILVYTGGASLTLQDSVVTGNTTSSGGDGAAIRNVGTLTIQSTTINGNTATGAGFAGAISNGGTLTIQSSTVTGNTTSAGGNGGAVFSSGPIMIQSSTLDGNTAAGGGFAGAIFTNGALTIQDSTLNGNAAPGGDAGAIFSNGPITIQSSTLNGNTAAGGGFGGAIFTNGMLAIHDSALNGNTADGNGGAIFSNSPVTIDHSTLSGNRGPTGASNAGGGGAIWANDTLSIASSTLDHNTAGASGATGYGGAIANNAALTLTNSTLSSNAANGSSPYGQGGALELGGDATLTNVTLAGNSAGAAGGNIDNPSSGNTATFLNTIIAGGSAPTGSNCTGTGTFTSSGHNIEGTSPTQCGLGAAGDLVGVDPLLGSLQDNGGPTFTQALRAGSPAINAGDNGHCSASDQRGVARPQGPACDIGAYEAAPPSASTGTPSGVGATVATLGGDATNPDAVPAMVYFQYGTSAAYGSQTAAQSLAAITGPTSFSSSAIGLAPLTLYHFRAVAANPDGTSFGADQTFSTGALPPVTAPTLPPGRPALTGLTINPRTFRAMAGRGASTAAKRKRGAIVSYHDSQAATTTFTVLRRTRGYRVGGRCVARLPRKHSKHVRRCTLYVRRGSFSHRDRSGANRFRFTGRVRRRPLRPGRYRLQAVARNSAGKKSRLVKIGFRIIR